ncbi:MAG: glucokinase [Chloroflexi bacterium]|nr:glucokinase [Chloroflexota bacterium]
MLLAGDLGGTKINLGVFSPEAGPRAPLVEATFHSADYPSLSAVVQQFQSQVDFPIDRASIGVAGPVMNGKATVTNLPWLLDEQQLAADTKIPSVHLLNDLAAIANAVPLMESADLITLNQGQAAAQGAMAVIAPGTGLGEAYLTWDGSRYRANPSEGGHTDYAPCTDLQIEMLRYLLKRFPHVSYEWVCSGIGLPNIYAFLKESGHAPEPAWLASQLAGAADPTPIIVNAALNQQPPCELCRVTLDIFIDSLGREAGNLALKILSTGGVYLAGGIPHHILPALQDDRFMRAFTDKGRLSSVLTRMPVHVILNSNVGLIGAAAYGLSL